MRHRNWMGSGICLALLLGQAPVLAEPQVTNTQAERAPPARETDSAFFITRSTNRNQVHYGITVDGQCRPQGPHPVHAYWRMLEKGEERIEPLLGREGPAYGLGDVQQVETLPHGWRIRVRLRAWPDRAIDLEVFPQGGHCAARAFTLMDGQVAQIERIFVKAKWPTGIDYVLLSGTGADGHSLREVIRK